MDVAGREKGLLAGGPAGAGQAEHGLHEAQRRRQPRLVVFYLEDNNGTGS